TRSRLGGEDGPPVQRRETIKPGATTSLHSVSLPAAQRWSAPVLIKSRFAARDGVKIFKLPDSVELTAVGSSRRSVTLLISNASIGAGGRSVQVSSPFWLLNESELPLLYREVRLGLVLRTQDLAGRSVVRAASAQHIRSSVDDALQLPARSPMSKRRTTSPLRAHARQAPERVDDAAA
ncbi:hypothetical protein T492DRAFT_857096, partial [Pavlovales sp. CCMP2436]